MRFPEQEIEAHAEHIGNLPQPVQIRGGLSHLVTDWRDTPVSCARSS